MLGDLGEDKKKASGFRKSEDSRSVGHLDAEPGNWEGVHKREP